MERESSPENRGIPEHTPSKRVREAQDEIDRKWEEVEAALSASEDPDATELELLASGVLDELGNAYKAAWGSIEDWEKQIGSSDHKSE